MSFTITGRLTAATLPKVLPAGLADFCPNLRLTEPITTAVFDGSVVRSGAVRKALRKIHADQGGSVLFAARDFTREARETITASGAQILSQTWWGWTDDSYLAIRIRRG